MLRVIEDTILSEIADAIREKTDTTETMQDYEMADKIRSISGGTEFWEPVESDVNFYDYDGTRLYAYTAAEFAALTSLPEFPSRPGLICQGWNWTLEDMQAYAAKYGMCDAGATYITDDGKTRFIVDIPADSLSFFISGIQSVVGCIHIDWGDGSDIESPSEKQFQQTHLYGQAGKYTVSISVDEGTTFNVGRRSNTNWFGKQPFVLHMGERTKFPPSTYGMNGSIGLRAISIPEGVTEIGMGLFWGFEGSMKCIVLPKTISTMRAMSFCQAEALEKIIFHNFILTTSQNTLFAETNLHKFVVPDGTTVCVNQTFRGCKKLEHVSIPETLVTIGDNAFFECASISDFEFLNHVTSIGGSAFAYCSGATEMVFAAGLTSVGANAFMCCGATTYDFTACAAIPTLGADAFYGHSSSFSIKVPAALLDAWKAAENWNSYADYIVGV